MATHINRYQVLAAAGLMEDNADLHSQPNLSSHEESDGTVFLCPMCFLFCNFPIFDIDTSLVRQRYLCRVSTEQGENAGETRPESEGSRDVGAVSQTATVRQNITRHHVREPVRDEIPLMSAALRVIPSCIAASLNLSRQRCPLSSQCLGPHLASVR